MPADSPYPHQPSIALSQFAQAAFKEMIRAFNDDQFLRLGTKDATRPPVQRRGPN